ncbi:pseudouridine synthase [Sphingomonas sp. RS2018]
MQRTGPAEGDRPLHRIAKLLARAGVASRREIERMIAEGRVALDGTTLDTPATLLPSLHGVTVDGEAVQAARPAQLFVFHKPAGVLTAAFDPAGRATIYDRLPNDLPRLMPVGRLDLNTEGLLLMTTDGELKRQLELPATGVERAYRARAYGDITQAQLEDLIDGIEVEGVRYGPIDANLERRTGANVWIEMILTEGKNREVRRVLEHLGLRVSRLIRTRYGPFVLGDLPVGGIGEVRAHDLIAFRASLKGNKANAVEEARGMAIAVTGVPKAERKVAPDVPVEDKRPARPAAPPVRPPARAPRAHDARPARPPRAAPTAERSARPGRPGQRPDIPRDERPPREAAARPTRDDRTARPAGRPPTDRTNSRQRTDSPRTERPAREHRTTTPAGRPDDRARPPRRRDDEANEQITTRPQRSAPAGERPKRGAGWAKAKPKPGARPGKPRRPRS